MDGEFRLLVEHLRRSSSRTLARERKRFFS